MSHGIAVETSGRVGSIALVDDGRVVVEEQFPHGLQHAALVIPIIDRLTRARGWRPEEIDELYLSIGPGSFTGLRIGVTLAKTMALATRVKVVAVPSVRVLAENAPQDARHLTIVLDAKRDQIFTARFARGPTEEWAVTEPAHLDSLPEMLRRAPRPVHLLGEGIPYHRKFIPADDPGVVVTPEETWRARASAVAQIGQEMSAAGEFADPFSLTPIYIRRPEAEEKFDSSGD